MSSPALVTLHDAPGLNPDVPYAYSASVQPWAAAAPQRIRGLLFTAGACPLDADGAVVAPGDVRTQAEQVMANLAAALAAAGAGLSDVLKSTVYVATTDRADLQTAWDVVRAAFGDHAAPSTLLGVTVLGWTGQLVEVEAVAVLPDDGAPAAPLAD
jgi:enamine deaminase RidA (YjgF/YER057c/UK114 family)